MLDQDYALITKMHALSNVHSTIQYLRSLEGDQIHNLTESQRRLIKYLLDNGMFNLNG